MSRYYRKKSDVIKEIDKYALTQPYLINPYTVNPTYLAKVVSLDGNRSKMTPDNFSVVLRLARGHLDNYAAIMFFIGKGISLPTNIDDDTLQYRILGFHHPYIVFRAYGMRIKPEMLVYLMNACYSTMRRYAPYLIDFPHVLDPFICKLIEIGQYNTFVERFGMQMYMEFYKNL